MPFTNPNTHSMGGKAVQAKLTREERVAKAKKAIAARYARQKKAA